ncbi:MAG: GNAT family N-acetyltransferase [Pyrinomonadaceae bacterium]
MGSFELQPDLIGELIELRPLRVDDWDGLYTVASDPLIWEVHPARDRYQESVFRDFFAEALASGGALATIDRTRQEIIGSSRYFGYDTEKSEVEIGWTFLARAYWGGRYNRELKQLMLDHAFRFVENVVFLIGPENWRSRRAVEKIGGIQIEDRTSVNAQGNEMRSVVYRIRKAAWAAPPS